MLTQVYEMMTKLGCWNSNSRLLAEYKALKSGLLFESMALDDIWQKYYHNIDHDVFNKCIQSDPTYHFDKPNKMGKYGKWILSLYTKGSLKLEDLYKVSEYLSVFVKYFNRLEIKDINQFKSIQELYNTISPFIGSSLSTSKSDETRKIKEGAEKVYEDDEWLVVVPSTKEASVYYGKGTQWCTAAEHSNNMFNTYNAKGPLYININKRTKEKYQFHFETSSFMDETDSPISPYSIGLSKNLLNFYESKTKKTKFDNGITVVYGLDGTVIEPNEQDFDNLVYLEDSYEGWEEWGRWIFGYSTDFEGYCDAMLVNTDGMVKYCNYNEDICSDKHPNNETYITHNGFGGSSFVAWKDGSFLDVESISRLGKGLIVSYQSYHGKTMNLISQDGKLLLDDDNHQYQISIKLLLVQNHMRDFIVVKDVWDETFMLYDDNFNQVAENWMPQEKFHQFLAEMTKKYI